MRPNIYIFYIRQIGLVDIQILYKVEIRFYGNSIVIVFNPLVGEYF